MTRRTHNNRLHQLVLPGIALLLLLTGFSPLAQAAPVCLADVDGPNAPPGDGQGDITRLCVDKGNLPASFDVYMSWDEDSFSGANTGVVPDG